MSKICSKQKKGIYKINYYQLNIRYIYYIMQLGSILSKQRKFGLKFTPQRLHILHITINVLALSSFIFFFLLLVKLNKKWVGV